MPQQQVNMRKRIAILRGINVGGKRSVLMKDLRQLFAQLGFLQISTYIQSGNVIFTPSEQRSNSELAGNIEEAMAREFSFSVPVLVRSVEELQQTLQNNPYYPDVETDISKLHLTMLKEKPPADNIKEIERHRFPPDEFVIDGRDVFIRCAGKYHETKLGNHFFEKKLKVPATTRTWRTVLKLVELAG